MRQLCWFRLWDIAVRVLQIRSHGLQRTYSCSLHLCIVKNDLREQEKQHKEKIKSFASVNKAILTDSEAFCKLCTSMLQMAYFMQMYI